MRPEMRPPGTTTQPLETGARGAGAPRRAPRRSVKPRPDFRLRHLRSAVTDPAAGRETTSLAYRAVARAPRVPRLLISSDSLRRSSDQGMLGGPGGRRTGALRPPTDLRATGARRRARGIGSASRLSRDPYLSPATNETRPDLAIPLLAHWPGLDTVHKPCDGTLVGAVIDTAAFKGGPRGMRYRASREARGRSRCGTAPG